MGEGGGLRSRPSFRKRIPPPFTGSWDVRSGSTIILDRVLVGQVGNIKAVITGIGGILPQFRPGIFITLRPGSFYGSYDLESVNVGLITFSGMMGVKRHVNSSTKQVGTMGMGSQFIRAEIMGGQNATLSVVFEPVTLGYNLHSFMGPLIYSNSTAGWGDQLSGSCGGAFAPDFVISWRSPGSGLYSFDTEGSLLDGSLYLIDATTGEEMGCSSIGILSGLALPSTSRYLLVIDGANRWACQGAAFYISIRLGRHDPLVTMTEVWQRLTVAKGMQHMWPLSPDWLVDSCRVCVLCGVQATSRARCSPTTSGRRSWGRCSGCRR
jgi:hypothetical protein